MKASNDDTEAPRCERKKAASNMLLYSYHVLVFIYPSKSIVIATYILAYESREISSWFGVKYEYMRDVESVTVTPWGGGIFSLLRC